MEHDHWSLGRWAGIPVAMHWTLLLSAAWLYLMLGDLLATAVAAVALFGLFVAHEFGHVWLLRRRRVPVVAITLNGLHGRTEHGDASTRDEGVAAWGGVLAQALVLVLASAMLFVPPAVLPHAAWLVLGPALFVLTKLNVFLIVVALLPIGPFDGRAAWALLRQLRRPRPRAPVEPKLTPEQRRDLEQRSAAAANELLQRLARRPDGQRTGGEHEDV